MSYIAFNVRIIANNELERKAAAMADFEVISQHLTIERGETKTSVMITGL
jgi:hypothetical protein